jgi:hypothetical protein
VSGADTSFWFNCVLMILLAAASVYAFRQLAGIRSHNSVGIRVV